MLPLLLGASQVQDPILATIAREAALLEANDAVRYPVPGAKVRGTPGPLAVIDDDDLARARLVIAREVPESVVQAGSEEFQKLWSEAKTHSLLPGISGYEDEVDEHQMLVQTFDVCVPNLASLKFATNNFLERPR